MCAGKCAHTVLENMNLVGEYESSDSEPDIGPEQQPERLPKPEFVLDTKQSVFVNNYVRAEDEKNAVLEQHVKMTDDPKHATIVNGRRICWEYRKGRCRFGHNCRFYHDSDIGVSTTASAATTTKPAPKSKTVSSKAVIVKEPDLKPRSKRPGLCQSLQPSKKIMLNFRQQNQEP